MARISGIDLPNNKRILIALTYIYGIGLSRARKILNQNSISFDKKTKDLDEMEVLNLRQTIENNYKVEGELRTEIYMNIKRLMEINSYKGNRHKKSLPVRGQRTKTNARTRKRKKKSPNVNQIKKSRKK